MHKILRLLPWVCTKIHFVHACTTPASPEPRATEGSERHKMITQFSAQEMRKCQQIVQAPRSPVGCSWNESLVARFSPSFRLLQRRYRYFGPAVQGLPGQVARLLFSFLWRQCDVVLQLRTTLHPTLAFYCITAISNGLGNKGSLINNWSKSHDIQNTHKSQSSNL